MRATTKEARMESNSPLVCLVTFVTLGSGLVNVYSVINRGLPERMNLLLEFFPFDFLRLSRTLTLVIGFALVVSSINIFKRKRRTVVGLTLFGVDKTYAAGFSVIVFILLTIPLGLIGFVALSRSGMTLLAVRDEFGRLRRQ